MVNFYSGFIVPEAARAAGRSPPGRLAPKYPEPPSFARRPYDAWSKQYKMPRGTIADVADHIDHIVKVAGIDHVGIGSDFDGITAWPVGLEDVSLLPAADRGTAPRGYSEADIHKILGGNVLRAFREAGGRRAASEDDGARSGSAARRKEPVTDRLERLQILDQVAPLVVAELVAEGVAAVAEAEARGVEDERASVRRRCGEGGSATVSNFQPTWTWS